MDDIDLGWLAGIFEGEGSAGVYDRGVCVYVGMTDRDIIDRIQELFPSPGVTVQSRKPGRKSLYVWRIRQRETVAEFLRLVIPLLGTRRTAQACAVLARAEDDGGLGSGHRRKTHCRNGHLYSKRNTSTNASGHRSCRTCRRLQSQRRRAT